MQTVRRLIILFSCLICTWVFTSVAGMFFDPGRIGFWSSSLMWSLLSSLLVAPALVIAFTGPSASGSAAGRQSSAEQKEMRGGSAPESSSVIEQSGGAYPVSDPSDE